MSKLMKDTGGKATLRQKLAEGQYNKLMVFQASLEHFMTTSNKIPKAARRIAYSFRGTFSIINKLNVGFGTMGKALEGIQGFFANPEATKGMKIFGGALSKINKTLGPKAVLGMALGAGKGALNLKKGGDTHLGKWSTLGTRRQRIIDSIKERADFRFGKDARGSLMEKLQKNGSKVLNFFNNNWRGIAGTLWNFLKMAGKMMFLAMFYITTIALAISLVYPVLKEGFMNMWEGIKESAVWIGEALGLVWEGVSDIFGFLFGDKTFNEMIDGILKIAFGLLWAAWAVIWGVIKAVWDLTTEIIRVGFWNLVDYLTKVYEESKFKFFFVIVGLVTAILLWSLKLPVILPAILLYIGWKLVKWAVDRLNPINTIKKAFGFRATGGMASGLTVVGERGPELVNLPRGSRVHSNAESRRMVGRGGINITINAHSLQDTELRRIAQKVGDMINRQVNRGTSSSTVR